MKSYSFYTYKSRNSLLKPFVALMATYWFQGQSKYYSKPLTDNYGMTGLKLFCIDPTEETESKAITSHVYSAGTWKGNLNYFYNKKVTKWLSFRQFIYKKNKL